LLSQDERCIEVRGREGRSWISAMKRGGESVRIHGSDIAVDAVYS
jgi:hypothetical protein